MNNPCTYDMTPINGVVAVTPGTALTGSATSRGFMVSVSGTISIVDAAGVTSVLTVTAGVQYWIRLTAVNVGGTATGIFALY